jgi:hypothetical protein
VKIVYKIILVFTPAAEKLGADRKKVLMKSPARIELFNIKLQKCYSHQLN